GEVDFLNRFRLGREATLGGKLHLTPFGVEKVFQVSTQLQWPDPVSNAGAQDSPTFRRDASVFGSRTCTDVPHPKRAKGSEGRLCRDASCDCPGGSQGDRATVPFIGAILCSIESEGPVGRKDASETQDSR